MSDDESKAKVRAEAAKRGLASYMNETKWLELQKAVLDELPFAPPFQRKDVLRPVAEPESFDADVWYVGDWREGILPFFSIEWIRIRPRYHRQRFRLLAPKVYDCGDALKAVLRRHHIPFAERDDSIWVYGYASQTPA